MVGTKRMYLAPLCAFLSLSITIIITYAMSTGYDHVVPVFPFISDTGALPPESCIFAEGFNITAVCTFITIFVRYLQVLEFSHLRPIRKISLWMNRISLILGTASCLGVGVLANFQSTNLHVVHLCGAFVCFSCGVLYFYMQSSLSRQMCPEVCSKSMVALRYMVTALCAVLTLVTNISAIIARLQFTGKTDNTTNASQLYLKWTPDESGYKVHLTSAVSEWLLVIFFCSFFLSYVWEFRNIIVFLPKVKLTNVEPEIVSASATNNNYEWTIGIHV